METQTTTSSPAWKAQAEAKLQAIIDKGKGQAESAIQSAMVNQPEDLIIHTPAMEFGWNSGLKIGFGDEVRLSNAVSVVGAGPSQYDIHEHALGQVCDKAGIPRKWMERLTDKGDWGEQLLVHNINEMYGHMDTSKHLIRMVQGQVRGFLSDRFRRIDTPLMVEAFASIITKYGAVLVEGYSFDTKFNLKVVLPQIFEPVPGEFMVLGISLKNSDFGDGAFELRLFMLRIWCKNLMVCEDGLRKVHIGSRIAQDFAISQRTYELDNKAMASATKDVVSQMLQPAAVKGKFALVQRAAETEVDIKSVLNAARKRGHMNIADAKSVTDIYNTGGIEMLPPGDNAWRLSNAVSYFAQQVEPERKLDLEVLAGQIAGLHE